MELALDLALILLLAATLFHALRLERALGVLKRDRAALEDLVASFNASTQMAEQGIERLRSSAEGAGRQITKQIERAAVLKDDLHFLGQRGEALADRLETAIRSSRAVLPEPAFDMPLALPPPRAPMLAQREPPREAGREPGRESGRDAGREFAAALDIDAPQPRLRSQAERDLLNALRMAR